MSSIRKRTENSYEIAVSMGYDVNGKKLAEYMTVNLSDLDPGLSEKQIEKELQRIAILFEDKVKRGALVDSKQNLASFIETWFSDYAEINLEPKTIHEYKKLLDRILPALGHIRLDKLKPNHFIRFYKNLSEAGMRKDLSYTPLPAFKEAFKQSKMTQKELAEAAGIGVRTVQSILRGSATTKAEAVCNVLNVKLDKVFSVNRKSETLSSNTIRHYHDFLSSVLSTAVEWQVIKDSPVASVRPPKVATKEANHYDEDMAEKMLMLLEDEPIKYRTMASLTVFAGVRLGELCGLEWNDVNFDNSVLRVRQASQYLPDEGIFTKDTKNESSYRVIRLPSLAVKVLKEYKVWQNEERLKCGDQWVEEWAKYPRLFTQWNGKPIFPSTPSQWFSKFRKRHNLPPLKFHDIRHTNASLLIAQGVDVTTISKRLGHSTPATTMKVYAHALRRPDQEAAEKLDKLFSKG